MYLAAPGGQAGSQAGGGDERQRSRGPGECAARDIVRGWGASWVPLTAGGLLHGSRCLAEQASSPQSHVLRAVHSPLTVLFAAILAAVPAIAGGRGGLAVEDLNTLGSGRLVCRAGSGGRTGSNSEWSCAGKAGAGGATSAATSLVPEAPLHLQQLPPTAPGMAFSPSASAACGAWEAISAAASPSRACRRSRPPACCCCSRSPAAARTGCTTARRWPPLLRRAPAARKAGPWQRAQPSWLATIPLTATLLSGRMVRAQLRACGSTPISGTDCRCAGAGDEGGRHTRPVSYLPQRAQRGRRRTAAFAEAKQATHARASIYVHTWTAGSIEQVRAAWRRQPGLQRCTLPRRRQPAAVRRRQPALACAAAAI